MTTHRQLAIFAQLRREIQEYRHSMLWTPVAIGGLLVLAILLSVLLANRLTDLRAGALEVQMNLESNDGFNITISLEEDEVDAATESPQDFVVIEEEAIADAAEEWDFSRKWTFRPPLRSRAANASDKNMDVPGPGFHVDSLNPAFNIVYALFQLILLFVTVNYLLGCLYQDRKDHSILFWKSMPVSEWQEVLCKMGIASFIVPLIYLAVSIIAQLLIIPLAMLMIWRLDVGSPLLVLDNIQFVSLFGGQLGNYLIWALWTAPIYAWLLAASAAARRSPFMLAFGAPIALMFIEEVFLGTRFLLSFMILHIPILRESNADSLGLYSNGSAWLWADYGSMLFGLLVAAGLLTGAVWLRRHRFEI